jgi:hypothetical protein
MPCVRGTNAASQCRLRFAGFVQVFEGTSTVHVRWIRLRTDGAGAGLGARRPRSAGIHGRQAMAPRARLGEAFGLERVVRDE